MGIIFIHPTLPALIVAFSLNILVGLGITIGYHRCLTHRAVEFKSRWLERFFVTLGALAFQGGPIWWCSIHRLHHKYSDTAQDPHNSERGFWYSHFFWLGHLDPRWRYVHTPEQKQHVVKDIARDPYYYALDKYLIYILATLSLWFILYLAGGWPMFFWGGPIALVFTLHSTFLVNSATHQWGYVSFDTHDNSKNNPLVAILAHGEGWHNNHHAFPSSAKNGFFRWWEFDLSYLVLRTLTTLGLVKTLRLPSLPVREKDLKNAEHPRGVPSETLFRGGIPKG
jgi:fatty-acid desaturase